MEFNDTVELVGKALDGAVGAVIVGGNIAIAVHARPVGPDQAHEGYPGTAKAWEGHPGGQREYDSPAFAVHTEVRTSVPPE